MAGQREVRAGRAFIEMFLKDGAFRRGLRRLRNMMQSVAASATRIAAGALALGTAIGVALIKPLRAASDLQETMSKFDTVFGDNARAVEDWGTTFGKQVGRSKNQVLGFLAATQDLLVPLGFAADDAENMSKQITQLAVDLGSFNNMADADVVRDLHAALTGSGEVMKKYGVIVSEATVKQEALNQGLDPRHLNEQQKALLRFQIILNGTTAAQGDAIKTRDQAANSWKGFMAAVENGSAALGQLFLPAATEALHVLTAFTEKLSNGEAIAAAKFMWSQLAMLWKNGTHELRKIIVEFANDLVNAFLIVFNSIERGFEQWKTQSKSNIVKFLGEVQIAGHLARGAVDKQFDEGAAMRRVDEVTKMATSDLQAMGAERRAALLRELDEQLKVNILGRDAELLAADKELEEARRAFEEAKAKAMQHSGDAQVKFGQGLPTAAELATAVSMASGHGGRGQSAIGTFDARFASQIFGGRSSYEREDLELNRDANRLLRMMQRSMKKIEIGGGIPVVG